MAEKAGHVKPFVMASGITQNLLIKEDQGAGAETRQPESLLVANMHTDEISVVIEYFHRLSGLFFKIAPAKIIHFGESNLADLTGIHLRVGDAITLTVNGGPAHALLSLREPEGGK